VEKLDKLNQPVEIQPSQSDVLRIVQITDSHIFADPNGSLLGVNTRDSFEAVCDRVCKEEWRADMLLATGDLAQDASPDAYQYIANKFKTMNIPSFWLAGNHDNPATMSMYLSNDSVFSAKHIVAGNWRIILLDSSVPGKVYGKLAKAQLDFLDSILKQHQDKHTLVALHHHPVKVGSRWLDNLGLKNSNQFKKVLSKYKHIKCVIYGHIHQDFKESLDDITWIATPASCVQFKPHSDDFSADDNAPGYRYLNLYPDGRIDSVVHRVNNIEFSVDYSVTGY